MRSKIISKIVFVSMTVTSLHAWAAPTPVQTTPAQAMPAQAAPMQTMPVHSTMAAEKSSASHFGQAEQFFFGGTTELYYQYQNSSPNGGGTSTTQTTWSLSPQIGFFIIPEFAVLLQGSIKYTGDMLTGTATTQSTSSETIIHIAPGIGTNLELSDSVSFAPNVLFNYSYALISPYNNSDNNTSSYGMSFNINLPFVFEVADHFAFSIAPFVNFSVKNTAYQLTSLTTTPVDGPSEFYVGGRVGILSWL